MNLNFSFFFTNILLGIGLAMDAFSVSLANGLNEPNMKKSKLFTVAGVFAGFQAAMPLIGWFCVTTLLELFSAFEPFIPWIALILLCFIGGKMLWEGIRGCGDGEDTCGVGLGALMVQGVATSIDALSVGFTIAHYNVWEALLAAALISSVTAPMFERTLCITIAIGAGCLQGFTRLTPFLSQPSALAISWFTMALPALLGILLYAPQSW